MRTHLEGRHTLVTSRKREYLPVVSHINDEINELESGSKNWRPGIPRLLRMPTMATYKGKTNLKTIWMPLMTRWTCFRSPHLLPTGALQSRYQGQLKNGSVR